MKRASRERKVVLEKSFAMIPIDLLVCLTRLVMRETNLYSMSLHKIREALCYYANSLWSGCPLLPGISSKSC